MAGTAPPHLSDYRQIQAPAGTSRLVASRFPPIQTFEAVSTPEDLAAVMELEGWTNDRLVRARLERLDRSEWVFGRPNASVVMAAFLHPALRGQRFSGRDLGAWYASSEVKTALVEVATGMRRELVLSGIPSLAQTWRQYKADLRGSYIDIFGLHPEFHDPDPSTYARSQAFGESVRRLGPRFGVAGIRYESVRRRGHENWVCYRPPLVTNVVQAAHFEIRLRAEGPVHVRELTV